MLHLMRGTGAWVSWESHMVQAIQGGTYGTNRLARIPVSYTHLGCALEGGGVPEHLDYRVWNVAYADGTSVRFDSVLGEALID